LVVIDYTEKMAILAVTKDQQKEEIVGVGRYAIEEGSHTANVAFVVRDDYQNQGIGRELLSYLTYLAKRQGLLGFSAEVLVDNRRMLRLFRNFEQEGFDIERKIELGVFYLKITFRDVS